MEEELLVLDAATLDLAPRAPQVLAATSPDPRLKLEMPAAQLEIATSPAGRIEEIAAELARGRHALAAAAGEGICLAAAGTHPFAAVEGELNRGSHYERMADEYGAIARRQLICGLHVHVAISGAERALAVYNALRSYLPELAALAANAPFYAGRDSRLASVRPVIAGLLPRQGVPPLIESWERHAEDLSFGMRSGRMASAREWWWELRPHTTFGTLEVRVPDMQVTVADTTAIAATVLALVVLLGERHAAGELPRPARSWRIAENRWSATRDGLGGTLVDLESGRTRSTRERVHELLDEVEPAAGGLGAQAQLRRARELAERGGAERQREIAAERGIEGLVAWLAASFLDDAGAPGSS